ncbi:MAG: C4-type zinc ribbon domain-containing protein [Myxococcota bacterium]|nr:C4-type zinc ribbon domain-containing protein [Myxococcota bacterium]
MRETLQNLFELQQLENALRDLRLAKEQLDQLTTENAETKVVFEEMLAKREEQLAEVKVFCREKETEIKDSESNARRARSRLNMITSQRELNALNKELDTARRTNQQRNEELKKLNAQLEEAGEDFTKKQGEYEALLEQMKAAEDGLRSEIAQREADSAENQARQAEIRGALDPATRSRFDRIARGRDGWAVAEVSAANEQCTACRMSVPPMTFIRLQRCETLESCQHCKRMLVFRPALFPTENAHLPAEDSAE